MISTQKMLAIINNPLHRVHLGLFSHSIVFSLSSFFSLTPLLFPLFSLYHPPMPPFIPMGKTDLIFHDLRDSQKDSSDTI